MTFTLSLSPACEKFSRACFARVSSNSMVIRVPAFGSTPAIQTPE